MFWVDPAAGTLAWDKPGKKSSKPNKGPFPLVSVLPDIPPERDARAWFKQADADGSGEIDADELAALDKKARGEKLSKARLKEAMAALDKDGNGTISFDEFQVRPQHHARPAPARVPTDAACRQDWWAENGGDLETHRALALTIVAGKTELLVVAPDSATKSAWVDVRVTLSRFCARGVAVAADQKTHHR